MARLTADQWAEARAQREAGATLADVARSLGVDRSLVSKRAKAEGWGDGSDAAELIRRRAVELVHGVIHEADPQKKAAAIDAAADKAADVVRRHRADWAEHRERFALATVAADFDHAKRAKIAAEMLAIRQAGERKSYGLDKDPAETTLTIDRGPAVTVYLPHNGR